jgi:PilZ domain
MSERWFKALRRGNQPSSDEGRERRQRERIEQYFDCTWVSAWGEERSRVSSLSPNGCYIESRSTAAEGAVVRDITIHLPSGPITLQGTAISVLRGVGFAVRFTEVPQDAHDRLSALARNPCGYPVSSEACSPRIS